MLQSGLTGRYMVRIRLVIAARVAFKSGIVFMAARVVWKSTIVCKGYVQLNHCMHLALTAFLAVSLQLLLAVIVVVTCCQVRGRHSTRDEVYCGSGGDHDALSVGTLCLSIA